MPQRLLVIGLFAATYVCKLIQVIRGGVTRALNVELTKKLTSRVNPYKPTDAKQLLFDSARKFEVDHKTYTAGMQICQESNDPITELEIFDFMKLKMIPNRLSYSMAITSCMNICDFDLALVTFHECDEHYLLGSSMEFRSHDIGLYAAIIGVMGKGERLDDVLDLFYRMRKLNMTPAEGTINTALQAAMKLNRWDDFETIKSKSLILFKHSEAAANTAEDPDLSVRLPQCKRELIDVLSDLRKAKDIEDVQSAILNANLDLCKVDLVAVAYPLQTLLKAYVANEQKSVKSSLTSNTRSMVLCDIRFFLHRLDEQIAVYAKATQTNSLYRYNGDVLDTKPSKIRPSQPIYLTLIKSAGQHRDAVLAFRYLQDAACKLHSLDRSLFRTLIEVCHYSGNEKLAIAGKVLLEKAFNGTSKLDSNTGLILPKASINMSNGTSLEFKNDLNDVHSFNTRALYQQLNSAGLFHINVQALPESGTHMSVNASKELLLHHCEKKALGYLLLQSSSLQELQAESVRDASINTAHGRPHISSSYHSDSSANQAELLRVSVNLCMCDDCHAFFKSVSLLTRKKIYCKDPDWQHVFHNGVCVCNDIWGGRMKKLSSLQSEATLVGKKETNNILNKRMVPRFVHSATVTTLTKSIKV